MLISGGKTTFLSNVPNVPKTVWKCIVFAKAAPKLGRLNLNVVSANNNKKKCPKNVSFFQGFPTSLHDKFSWAETGTELFLKQEQLNMLCGGRWEFHRWSCSTVCLPYLSQTLIDVPLNSVRTENVNWHTHQHVSRISVRGTDPDFISQVVKGLSPCNLRAKTSPEKEIWIQISICTPTWHVPFITQSKYKQNVINRTMWILQFKRNLHKSIFY